MGTKYHLRFLRAGGEGFWKVIEEWESRAAYDAYAAFRTEQGMMDQMAAMLTAPPETRFWDAKVA